jgi:hypothetical protein
MTTGNIFYIAFFKVLLQKFRENCDHNINPIHLLALPLGSWATFVTLYLCACLKPSTEWYTCHNLNMKVPLVNYVYIYLHVFVEKVSFEIII